MSKYGIRVQKGYVAGSLAEAQQVAKRLVDESKWKTLEPHHAHYNHRYHYPLPFYTLTLLMCDVIYMI